MNAPVKSAGVGWDLRQPYGRLCIEDPRAMKLAARLAAAIVNPLSIVADATAALPAWPDSVIRKMAAHRKFGPPLQRAVARAFNFDTIPLAPEFFDRLTSNPGSRLCIILLTDPLPAIRSVAMDLAATILHRRILGIVLKPHRAKLRQVLGEDGLRLATQEAAMLYPNLAELDRPTASEASLCERDEAGLKEVLTATGMIGLGRLVEFCEPALRDMFSRRSPQSGPTLGAFTERHCDQALKLFRRRTPAWSAIID